ncbi:hypothetical protein JCM5296_006810 [Sporobolomyces johnsonii]
MAPASSLLSTAHSLRSHLVASLSPALPLDVDSSSQSTAHLHPLSSIPPTSIPSLRSHLHASLDSLRTALSSFQSLLPTPPPTSLDPSTPAPPLPAPAPAPALTDKYLSLLRESALAQSALLASNSDDRLTSSRLVARRASYEHLYPVLHPAEAATPELVLPILERLANEVGLVCFRDDNGAGAQQEHVTLSLGGKVMVVDLEVVRNVHSGGDERGQEAREREQVSKVKVAYVFEGADLLDERAAAKLQALFDGLQQDEEGGRETRWKGVRQLLRELHVLDERTESEGRDCFMLVEQLQNEVEQRVKELQAKPEYVPLSCNLLNSRSPPSPSPSSASTSTTISTLPLLLPTPHSLSPTLLISSTPSARLSSAWSDAFPPSSSSTPPNHSAIEALLTTPGIQSLCLSLADPPAREGEGEAAKRPTGYRARVRPAVPVGKRTGRSVVNTLGLTVAGAGAKQAENDKEHLGAAGQGKDEAVWMEDLLSAVPSTPTSGPEPPARFDPSSPHTIAFDDLPSDVPSAFSFRLADPRVLRGYLCTELACELGKVKDLFEAVEILKEQIELNELVRSVFSTRRADDEKDGAKEEEERSKKRRKLGKMDGERTEQMGLDELFSSATVPVYLHISPPPAPSSSSQEHPSIALSFPTPHLPPSSASPMSLVITSSSEGLTVRVQASSEEIRGKLGADEEGRSLRMEEVLRVGGDLGLLMRWVCRRLCL